jgi:hypothetical protein
MLAKMHGLLLAAAITLGLSGQAFAAPLEKTELRYRLERHFTRWRPASASA